MMAALFILYIVIRCRLQPELGPPLSESERNVDCPKNCACCAPAFCPLVIFAGDDGAFCERLDKSCRKLRYRRHDGIFGRRSQRAHDQESL